MPFSLHIFYALAALTFVLGAAVLGAQQRFDTISPGGVAVCGSAQPSCGAASPVAR
jgi:hypothetical protein